MSDIQTWSNTAASNNATPPNGFPEGMAPSTVNDAARELMAAVSRYRSDTDGVNTSSGTNTITLAASRTMTAYAQGDLYTFKAGGTNTGATTLNVDSLGAKDVQFNGAACTGGEIVSGLMYTVVYDGTQFQLLNASSYPAIDITTLEVTNIKAKDGTAAMTIANSTGIVTVGSLNPGFIDGGEFGSTTPILSASILTAVVQDAVISNLTAYGAIVETTDNTNAALRVTQLGTANALEIEDSTNPDATPFIVNASGNLIQGYTTAVASKILTTATTPAWQAHGVQLGSYSWTNNATFPGFFVFNKSKSGVFGTLSAVTDGDNLGVIQFNGADNDATPTFNMGAYISAQVAGTVASTSIPGRLNFATTSSGATSSTVKVSITPEGYLGVGATPTLAQQLLDLRGTNNGLTSDTAVNTLRFTDTDTTTVANQPIGKIEFASSDLDNAAVGAYILASSVGTAGGGTIRFGAAANAGAVAEVARVASTGLTVTLDTAGLGYGTGTGGTVTQATSRTTGVTLNKTNGSITLVSAAGTATWQSFTVTNSTVAATDVVVLSQRSGTDLYMLEVTAVAAGSFRISFATTGGTTTEQPVFNFAVIKAVNA